MHVATSLVHTPLACETDRLGVVEDLAPAAHAHSGASAASGGETLLELHWRVFPRLLMPLLPDHLEPELDDHEGRVVITVASVPDGSSDLVLTVAADVRSVLNDLTGQHVIAQYRGPAGLAADDPGVGVPPLSAPLRAAPLEAHSADASATFWLRHDMHGHLLGIDVIDAAGEAVLRCSRSPMRTPRGEDTRAADRGRDNNGNGLSATHDGQGNRHRREWVIWAQSRLPQWLDAGGGQYELQMSSCRFNGVHFRP